jgi:hypothetical protein
VGAGLAAPGPRRTVTRSAQPPGAGEVLERVPYRRLLLAPTFIGCCLAALGAYWGLSLGLTWFAPFIVKVSAIRRRVLALSRHCHE